MTAPAPGRHRRPVKARTRGPSKADPRHRRDVEPDPPDIDAGAGVPHDGAGRENGG